MARTNLLTALAVQRAKTPGRLCDGGGLYLVVEPSLAKRWAYVFQWEGKRKEMGLGPFATVSLAQAREKREAALKLRSQGFNPIEHRRAGAVTGENVAFGLFALATIKDLEPGWRSPVHRAQWRTTLETYCALIWTTPIDQVTTDHVLAILRPIWTTKAETASRVRSRIERVLNVAKAKGLRSGENPAQWRGHLEFMLPARSKLQRGHHPALPYVSVPDLVPQLQERRALGARALLFTIATVAREGEALNATWREFDLGARLWTLPPHRMKAGKEHRVPLNDVAMGIIGPAGHPDDLVFPGAKPGKPLSNMTMDMLLRRMTGQRVTVHGFRSTFRDWAGDTTDHPREVIEAALAHTIGNAAEQAYRRSDALEKRRRLMDDWSAYLLSCSSNLNHAIAAE